MRILVIIFILFCSNSEILARTIFVSNSNELTAANKNAEPGDTVILRNGVWNDLAMILNCVGTDKQPILFKAQTPGKVIISGRSHLRLGGRFVIVDGLLFENGYSPSNAVIDFKISNKELADHCRVTNCVINDFNKPKRMSDDQWVSFSGKNNRIDHCSFFDKKNMGVLLAVLLDDERSRENFHSIDHNYFGIRPPLGSNGGEIIRVGLSQHAQFNSSTQIKNNFFEHCDGEAEIISIKSGNNVVSENIFKESQGSVVLRHGDFNTVINNIFLGNDKEATGGVRIVNKGQWVINNFFYKCRGESFRAPLAIMNGIPNSPANRYVQVTDAVVMNNSFIDCAPMSLGEGSDKERSLAPANVLFARNIFYNRTDTIIYKAWDVLTGIRFLENKVSQSVKQKMQSAFDKTSFKTITVNGITFPTAGSAISKIEVDSLRQLDEKRLPKISSSIGFGNLQLLKTLTANSKKGFGAKWFNISSNNQTAKTVRCKTSHEIENAISGNQTSVNILLTGTGYHFEKPVVIDRKVRFTSDRKKTISFSCHDELQAVFLIEKNGNLLLDNLDITTEGIKAHSFISTDTMGSSEHYKVSVNYVKIKGLKNCGYLLYAYKSTFADSLVIKNSSFTELNNGISLADEKDDRGYYNAENIIIVNNEFKNGKGMLLNIYRGGTDESTLGPNILFSKNKIIDYNHPGNAAIIQLTGAQKTKVLENRFSQSNNHKNLIEYRDFTRARHLFKGNTIQDSGSVVKNEYVTE